MTTWHPELEPNLEWLEGVVAHVFDVTGINPETCAAVIGSVAEGLGNAASDIDVLVVLPGDTPFAIRSHTAWEGRRVEAFLRNRTWMRTFALWVERSEFELSEIDFYQRITRAIPIRNGDEFRSVQAHYDVAWLEARMSSHYHANATLALTHAKLRSDLGCADGAVELAVRGLRLGLKAALCRSGETYVADKYLMRQLHRSRLPEDLVGRCEKLLHARHGQRGREVVSAAMEECQRVGVAVPRRRQRRVVLLENVAVTRTVTQCLVGNSDVTVVVDDPARHVFQALSERSLRVPAGAGLLDETLLMLLELGLTEDDHGLVERRSASPAPPHVTGDGVVQAVSVKAYAVSPARIASSMMDVIQAMHDRENLAEDLIGAIRSDDLDTVGDLLPAMADNQGLLLIAQRGIHPLPTGLDLGSTLADLGMEDAAAEFRRLRKCPLDSKPNIKTYLESVDRLRDMRLRSSIDDTFVGYPWSALKALGVTRHVGKLLPFFKLAGRGMPGFIAEHAQRQGDNVQPTAQSPSEAVRSRDWELDFDLAAEVRKLA